jgi:hypothetical protein
MRIFFFFFFFFFFEIFSYGTIMRNFPYTFLRKRDEEFHGLTACYASMIGFLRSDQKRLTLVKHYKKNVKTCIF